MALKTYYCVLIDCKDEGTKILIGHEIKMDGDTLILMETDTHDEYWINKSRVIYVRKHTPPVRILIKLKDPCPICGADSGKFCVNRNGENIPSHVARYKK